jgi:hypothetical protein
VKLPGFFIIARLLGAEADSARVGLAIERMRAAAAAAPVEPPRGGMPRLTTIEVVPEEIGANGVKLDEASRAKLAAAGADPD